MRLRSVDGTHGSDVGIPLCTRPDLPFGHEVDALRENILAYQRSKRLDDVMEVFEKSKLKLDSPDGRTYLEQLIRDAGLPEIRGRPSAPR